MVNTQTVLDLIFPDPPVTFKFIEGTGTIHLLGNHSVDTGELVGDDEDKDELEDNIDVIIIYLLLLLLLFTIIIIIT